MQLHPPVIPGQTASNRADRGNIGAVSNFGLRVSLRIGHLAAMLPLLIGWPGWLTSLDDPAEEARVAGDHAAARRHAGGRDRALRRTRRAA